MVARLWPKRHRPQVVRRVGLACPVGYGQVEVDFLMHSSSRPERVLRCDPLGECPSTCHQPCRLLSEAIAGPPEALLLLPPDARAPHEED